MPRPSKTESTAPSSTVPARQVETLRALLDGQQGEIAKALVRGIEPAYFGRAVLTACRFSPALLECAQTPRGRASLMLAVLHAAALGLEPNTPLGLCYLVPYAGLVSLQIGYKGFLQLAWRAATPVALTARVVREHDEHEYVDGLKPVLRHVPRPAAEGGEMIAAYAIGRTRSAPPQIAWLWREEIEAHRAMSPAWQAFIKGQAGSTPWNDWPEAMWRKTAIRALASYLPLSPACQRALAIDDVAQEPDEPTAPASKRDRLAALIDVETEPTTAVEEAQEGHDGDGDTDDAHAGGAGSAV